MQSVLRFTGHKGSIYTIEPGPDSTFFTSGSEGIIAQWNPADPESGELLARVPGVVYSLYFLNNEFLLAGTAHGKVHVIDMKLRREVRLLQYHSAPVFRLAFWEQQNLFFSLAGDGTIQVYDALLNPVYALKPSEGKLRTIAFADNYFIIGTSEGKIQRYSTGFELLNTYAAHQDNFGVNALWLNNSILVSGGRDAHLIVSDPVSGQILNAIPAHNYAIYRIAAMLGNPAIFATASRDKTVKLWDASNFNPILRLDAAAGGHVNSVNDLTWINPGLLVSVGDDRCAIAWSFVK
jgi:WD40 repeat protein